MCKVMKVIFACDRKYFWKCHLVLLDFLVLIQVYPDEIFWHLPEAFLLLCQMLIGTCVCTFQYSLPWM